MPWRVALLLAALAVLVAPPVAAASDVVVQGTTDVRDAGLLDDVIVPGFKQPYPQYTLKYIAVGTGQALTNAEAGQGDAVLTHAPTLESQFVADGFSYEPFGRAIFYSDYVIPGRRRPRGRPGGRAARRGSRVRADRPGRRGGQGELRLAWRQLGHERRGEADLGAHQRAAATRAASPARPAPRTTRPGTTRRAPARRRPCRSPTSARSPAAAATRSPTVARSTGSRLRRAVTNLKIVADKNDASARGGLNLLLNSFHAYAVNPAKNPNGQPPGGACVPQLPDLGRRSRSGSRAIRTRRCPRSSPTRSPRSSLTSRRAPAAGRSPAER